MRPRTKKNLYALSEDVMNFVRQKFSMHVPSHELDAAYRNVFLPSLMDAPSGRSRYPGYYRTALSQAYYVARKMLEREVIIFGYWYKGKFYTTDKGTQHKTTQVLHDMRLSQDVWDTMPRGLYYVDNLKPYYAEEPAE